MVLPQLDAYHAGRQLQHLQPWVSVELAQQKKRGQTGTRLQVTYQYEAYAGFHVIHLHTDGAPLLLFSAPSEVPTTSLVRLTLVTGVVQFRIIAQGGGACT